MTPQRLQELKAKLAKHSPEAQKRILKAAKASRDVTQFKHLCNQVNSKQATPAEMQEYQAVIAGSKAKTSA